MKLRSVALLLVVSTFCVVGSVRVAQPHEGRPAVAHRQGGVSTPKGAGRVVGDTRRIGGFSAIEPTLGFTKDGTVFFTAMQSNTDLRVVRSDTAGKSWTDISPILAPGVRAHQVGVDPYLYVDPWTSRVFTIDLTVACSYLSFSDSEGAEWTTNPLACGRPINDHQTLFAGPPVSSSPVLYPNVVYYCFNDLITSSCTKSLDGGITFSSTGEPAFGPGGNSQSETCGGLHGHGVVGQDGTVYLPKEWCGDPYVAISKDEGATWDQVRVSSMRMNEKAADPSVAVDARGNLYYAWIGIDRLPYLAVSKDGGSSWSKPMMMGAPSVTEANLVTIDVGAPGRVAIAYAGSTDSIFQTCRRDPRCRPPKELPTWHAFIAQSSNVLSRKPLFLSAAANRASDPIVSGACGPGRCSYLVDFIDVEIAPDGTPWGAFVDDDPDGEGEAFVATLRNAPSLR